VVELDLYLRIEISATSAMVAGSVTIPVWPMLVVWRICVSTAASVPLVEAEATFQHLPSAATNVMVEDTFTILA
jgi:hypothetical protein